MAFWKKFYKSKYTGAEIDAAVAKADTVPAVTVADAGKILGVNNGQIVAEHNKINCTYSAATGLFDVSFSDQVDAMGKGKLITWTFPKTFMETLGIPYEMTIYPNQIQANPEVSYDGAINGYLFFSGVDNDIYFVNIDFFREASTETEEVDIHIYTVAKKT